MGNTVNSTMTDSRMDLDVSDATEALTSVPPFKSICCRITAQVKKMPPTTTTGATVVSTSRSWKLLSNTQFKGKNDSSNDKNPKFSQKDIKRGGSSSG